LGALYELNKESGEMPERTRRRDQINDTDSNMPQILRKAIGATPRRFGIFLDYDQEISCQSEDLPRFILCCAIQRLKRQNE
jgi:hypothetical protein